MSKISILLSTYNVEKYLKEQLDSLFKFNQTYKNFTLIISDDFSPNKEVIEVLKEYQQKDDRPYIAIFF